MPSCQDDHGRGFCCKLVSPLTPLSFIVSCFPSLSDVRFKYVTDVEQLLYTAARNTLNLLCCIENKLCVVEFFAIAYIIFQLEIMHLIDQIA